jgi:hypothetical protein
MEGIARVLTGGFLGLVFVCLVPLLAVLGIGRLIYGAMLKLWWWRKHGQHGRDFLVVYSESPKWSGIVSERILPVLGARAVVENVSKDSSWKAARSLERRVHKHWAGEIEHTPIVIKVPPFAKVVQVASGLTVGLDRRTRVHCICMTALLISRRFPGRARRKQYASSTRRCGITRTRR